jgi:hypothetical protein
MTTNGRALLSDFGLSRLVSDHAGSANFTSTIGGAVQWVAIDLFYPDPDNVVFNDKCDVYSFGSVMLQVRRVE